MRLEKKPLFGLAVWRSARRRQKRRHLAIRTSLDTCSPRVSARSTRCTRWRRSRKEKEPRTYLVCKSGSYRRRRLCRRRRRSSPPPTRDSRNRAVVAREGQPAGDRRGGRRSPTAEKAKAATARRPRSRAFAAARPGRARRGDGGGSAASLATATPAPGPSRRGARRGKGVAQTRRAGGLGQPAGCRQRAGRARACGRCRRGGGEATGRRAGGRRERRKNSFDERREPREMSGALWALPRSTGTVCVRTPPHARRRPAPARRAARGLHAAVRRGRGGRAGNRFSEHGRRGFGRVRETHVSAVSSLAAAARLASDASLLFPLKHEHASRRAAARVDRALAEPLAAAFFATATAAGAPPPSARGVPPNKKRRSLRNRVARVARRRRALRRHLDFCDVSFSEDAKPRRTASPRRSRRRRSLGCERRTRNNRAAVSARDRVAQRTARSASGGAPPAGPARHPRGARVRPRAVFYRTNGANGVSTRTARCSAGSCAAARRRRRRRTPSA